MGSEQVDLNVYSRKWGEISLLENISKFKNRNEPTNPLPKRSKTDFFPNRQKGRRKYKEKVYFLINPDTLFKAAWDAFKICLIMIQAIIIPYMLSFSPKDLESYQLLIEYTELYFFIDMIFTFNTEVYFKGLIFSSRLFIAKVYMKSSFLPDLVSIFPFQLILPNVTLGQERYYISGTSIHAIHYLWLLKLLRLFQLKALVYRIEDYFVSTLLVVPIQITVFFYMAFMWIHWMACILHAYFIRGLESDARLWLRFLEDPLDNYLRFFYLVMETMTSVGYGDILPLTITQYFITIICMCFTCVLFGHIIGNIQGTIESYDANGKYYETTARRLKNYLNRHKLPEDIRKRVIQYIYYLKRMTKHNDPKELGLLDGLSAPLREEIFTQTRGFLLAKSAVFRSYSGAFLKYLGHQMKIEVYAPGDSIFKQGELSKKIYYLSSGSVQIYHESTKTVFKDLKASKYFGEIAFFLGKPRTASAMPLVFSEFLVLERESLFNVLQARPKEMEITNVIIYNTEKYKNLGLLGIRCYLCRKLGHVAKDCVKFIYIPDKTRAYAKAEAKKYLNRKEVNLFSENTPNFIRPASVSEPIKYYDVYCTKGKPFTPGLKYKDNRKIISKAWSMEGKSSGHKFSKMLSIKEGSHESDSNDIFEDSCENEEDS